MYGIIHMQHEPSLEAKAAMVAAAVSPPAPPAQNQVSHALAPVQAEANAVAAAPAVSPRVDTEDNVPAFDVARIEQTGDAVIAGRAAPGATVELLRNGESLDRAVADQSGQFVMIPPRLPAGTYALTLRSREPDGRQTLSKQSVAVALAEPAPSSAAIQAHAALPSNAPGTTTANRSAPDGSSQARAPSQPALQLAKQQDATVSTAAARSDGSSLSAAVPPRKSTTVVSRGDSLWRISRLTYGEGTRYALVYRANRDRIRNPDRIYPGQVFVLPLREH
ncbi:MAG TPA: LysM peptidoglycan-binding domain-containing protein [Bradyrhizobium sp.]